MHPGDPRRDLPVWHFDDVHDALGKPPLKITFIVLGSTTESIWPTHRIPIGFQLDVCANHFQGGP